MSAASTQTRVQHYMMSEALDYMSKVCHGGFPVRIVCLPERPVRAPEKHRPHRWKGAVQQCLSPTRVQRASWETAGVSGRRGQKEKLWGFKVPETWSKQAWQDPAGCRKPPRTWRFPGPPWLLMAGHIYTGRWCVWAK